MTRNKFGCPCNFLLGELFQKANSKQLLGDISTFTSNISRRNFIPYIPDDEM
ncbi:MAG: hypothetical protein QNJ68_07820 [Microcoleaceae cyanobacterium MO_207.B10]|nr:hypothetical protein [Microcoleaceae cyanobacterium MO_207.B10]